MVIPQIYRKSTENVVANYDFIDLFQGIAYKTYYGCAFNTSGGTTYSLSPTIVSSNPLSTDESGAASGAWFVEKDIDFDAPFTGPRIIKGDFQLNVPISFSNPDVTADVQYKLYANIIKWDGSTETNLVSAFTTARTIPSSTTESQMHSIIGTIPTTKFSVGDSFRLNLQLLHLSTGASTAVVTRIGHDPQSRTIGGFATTGHDDTTLSINIPMKIDQ